MRIVDQSYEIVFFEPETDLQRICMGARLCYKSKDLTDISQMAKFVKSLRDRDPDNPHHSPLEHSSMSVIFTTNRGISHELVRHRLASFSQESTRYCNYQKDRFSNEVTFIRDSAVDKNDEFAYQTWLNGLALTEAEYFDRLKNGYSPEQARGCLTNDVKTEIMVTANYREWRHIFKLRCDKHAHYQMRELMIPLFEYVRDELPCVFDDITF